KNIVAVDPRRWRERDRYFGRRANFEEQLLAPLGGEFLGIVEALWNALGVEDDCRRGHRSGERRYPCLVAAGDRGEPTGISKFFSTEIRAHARSFSSNTTHGQPPSP